MVPNYYLESVLPLGVLTGSRAFNCFTEESDWDIVILEKDLPDWELAEDYQSTDFNRGYYDESGDGGKPGYDLSEHSEFDDDPFLEYDQATIWGPLVQIIKYWYYTDLDKEICINLFVYSNYNSIILDKFKELNALMKFTKGSSLKDKEIRIQAFTEIINKVGITDTPY